MKLVPILLSDYGYFNLHPELLKRVNVSLNSLALRVDVNLVNLFNTYNNKIAQNCIIRKEDIPEEMLNKVIQFNYDVVGKESLSFFETNGDVVMKYW